MSKYYVYKTALPNQVIILTFVDLIVCESLMWEVYLVNKNLRRVSQDAENFLCR